MKSQVRLDGLRWELPLHVFFHADRHSFALHGNLFLIDGEWDHLDRHIRVARFTVRSYMRLKAHKITLHPARSSAMLLRNINSSDNPSRGVIPCFCSRVTNAEQLPHLSIGARIFLDYQVITISSESTIAPK